VRHTFASFFAILLRGYQECLTTRSVCTLTHPFLNIHPLLLHTQTLLLLATKIVGQETQRPEEAIPEGGSIPKHRDATLNTPSFRFFSACRCTPHLRLILRHSPPRLPGQIRLRLARPANASVLQRYINMVGDSAEMVGARRCSVPLSVCRSQPEGWARSAAGNSRAAAAPVQP